MHLRAEGQGKLLTLLLTPGQQHESTVLERLLDQGAIKRVGRGRPKLRPERLVGDKGYTGRRLRQAVRQRGIRVTIPHQRTERHRGSFDRAAYRLRNRIERLVNLCKESRRLATRYEQLAENYRAMWVLAAILHWIR